MKSFKIWLISSGYDIGLQENLLVDEHSWGKTQKVDMFKLAEEWSKYRLTEYTDFLLKEGYCDCDVYTEPQSAIDRFLNPKLR